MYFRELSVSSDNAVLLSDTFAKMEEFILNHQLRFCPVVDSEGKYLGMLNAQEILLNEKRTNKESSTVGEYEAQLTTFAVFYEEHFYNLFKYIDSENFFFDIIPLIDKSFRFKGIVKLTDYLLSIQKFNSLDEPGGIFTIKLGLKDYNLAEIVRLIEAENIKVLFFASWQDEAAQALFMTFKVNRLDIKVIEDTLNRFEYYIEAFYSNYDEEDEVFKRYKHLMKFLDI